MKKLYSILFLLIFTLSALAQNNPFNACVAGSGTNCTTGSGSPFIIDVTAPIADWPYVYVDQEVSITAVPSMGLPGLLDITTTNEYCEVTETVEFPTNSIISNYWTVSVPPYSQSGTGLDATFIPTNAGSGTLIFHLIYAESGCGSTNTNSVAMTNWFTVQDPTVVISPTNPVVSVGSTITFTASIPSPVLPPVSSGDLRLWLRADDGIVTNSSGAVTQWLDQSVYTNNAWQSNTNNQPSVVYPAAIGGRAAVHFNGIQDNVHGDYLWGSNQLNLTNAFTYFNVYNFLSATNTQNERWVAGVPGTTYGSCRIDQIDWDEWHFSTWAYDWLITYAIPTNTYRIATVECDTNLDHVTLSDVSATSFTNGDLYISDCQPVGAGYYVGGLDPSEGYTGSGRNFYGDMAEILCYSGALSDNDVFNVTSYLEQKYINVPSFQWQLNGVNIAGATNSTLTLTNVQDTNQGDYSVVIRYSDATNYSTNSLLSVVTPIVNYSNFCDVSALQINHNALQTTTSDGCVLELTPPANTQNGSAFLTNPVVLTTNTSFSTFFSFRLSAAGPPGYTNGEDPPPDVIGADGIMFVLQSNGPTAYGWGGGYLGYGYDTSGGNTNCIPNSLGVEFDTYGNDFPTHGQLDPILPVTTNTIDGNHVGIDTNGSVVSMVTSHVSDYMNNSNVWYAWIDYDAGSTLLTLKLSETNDEASAPQLLSQTVNILSYLGTTNAYIGFTGGTGSFYNQQDILSWQLSTFTATSNLSYSIAITSPTNGARVNQRTNTLISTTISAPTGTSNYTAEVFDGTNLIGTSAAHTNAVIVQIPWLPTNAGVHNLSAVLLTNSTVLTTSAVVEVTVPYLPTVSIASPANFQTFLERTNVSIIVNASETNGSIASVEVFGFNPTNLLGSATNSGANQFTFVWSNLMYGNYPVFAMAIDTNGVQIGSQIVVFTVTSTNPPPFVQITYPTNGQVFVPGCDITITALAYGTNLGANTPATVTNVEFYVNNNDIGGCTNNGDGSNIYTITECCWKPGTYQITAVASDNYGMTSATNTIITIASDAPTTEGFWDAPFGLATGQFLDPDAFYHTITCASDGTFYFKASYGSTDSPVYSKDGTNWTVLDTAWSGAWNILMADGTNLYVAGNCDGYSTSQGVFIWDWADSEWLPVGNGLNSPYGDSGVRAMAMIAGNLYVAGYFVSSGASGSEDTNVQYIARLNTNDQWVAVGNGGFGQSDLDEGFQSPISVIASIGGDVYIGGTFIHAGGNTNANYIACLNGGTWTNLGSGLGVSDTFDSPIPVGAIAACGTNLFVGGEFDVAGGNTNARGIAIWNTVGWRIMDGGPGPATVSREYDAYDDFPAYQVFSISPRGDRVFVVGAFSNIFNDTNFITANNVAMATWSDSDQTWTWSDLDSGTGWAYGLGDGATWNSLLVNGASPDMYDLYVSGEFNMVGSANLSATAQVARWRVGYPHPAAVPTIAITNLSSPVVVTNTGSFTTNLVALAASVYTNIVSVNFYANGTSIGSQYYSVTNIPSSFVCTQSWSPTSVGLYLVTATTEDAAGQISGSSPIVVNVKSLTNAIQAIDDQYVLSTGTLSTNLHVLANDISLTPLKISQITPLHGNLGTVQISFDRSYLMYTPFPNDYGTDIFFYTVTNSAGNSDSASVTVNILAPPQVSISMPGDQSQIPTSSSPLPVTATATAVGEGNTITNVSVLVYASNSIASLNLLPVASVYSNNWTNSTPGWYTFVASAVDLNGLSNLSAPVTIVLTNSGSGSDILTAAITNLADASATEVDFSAQVDPIITNGIFDLRGQASDSVASDPVSYQVLLYKPDNGIATIGDDWADEAADYASESPFANLTPGPLNDQSFHSGGDNNGDLGPIDFSSVPNGIYELILQVRGGTQVTNTMVEIQLNSNLKIGQFSFSEQDMVFPCSGIPITVTRTYNSMNPVNADFGYNWTFAINSMNVQLDDTRQDVSVGGDQAPYAGNSSSGNGLPPTISIRTGGGWDVTLTLPDGRTETFQATFDSLDLGIYQPRWTAPPGVNYTLTNPNNDQYYGFEAGSGWDNTEGYAFDNFDIAAYQLVNNATGVTYNITRGPKHVVSYYPDMSGNPVFAVAYGQPTLTSIVQPSGDQITLSSTNITHLPPGSSTPSRSISISRDGSRRIIAIYDPNGTNTGLPAVQYVYNQTTSNLIQVLKLVNATTGTYTTNFYDYNNPNFPHYITSMENGDGVTVARNFYDNQGLLIEVEDANGNLTQFIHNTSNSNEVVIDQLGRSNAFAYDGNGNVLAKTNASGQVTTMAYDANNNQTNTVTYLGTMAYATNTTIYDQNNLPLTATDPLGNTTTYAYTGWGWLANTTDPLNHVTYNNYDGDGNLTNSVDALGNSTTNTYGGGMIVGSSDSLGNVTTNVYDANQNLLNSAQLDASGHIVSSNSFTYDLNGNRLTSTVWRQTNGVWGGATTTSVYDSQNRVIQTINPDGGTNTTVYDGAGHQVQTTDARGNTTSYGYDYMGRLVLTTYPDNSTESSAYDATGNRTNSTDRLGRVIVYFYDALNRLTNMAYADGASNVTVYDGVGRVLETIDARGMVTAYGYDVASRRIAVTNAYGTSLTMASAYAYDADGNQTNFTDPLQRMTTNVFDALNRQMQTLSADGTEIGIAYDGDGRKIAQTNQDGYVTWFGYDGTGRLTSVTDGLTNTTRYQYDEAGNEICQIDALNRTNVYVYDGMGRRIGHLLPGGQAEEMLYDLNGNLTFMTNCNGVVITNKYDALNRLTNRVSAGGYQIQFAYSATGQRTNMIDPSGTTGYAYDVRDRLTNKVTTWNGGFNIALNYAYDANGNVTNLASSTGVGASVIYAYDGLNRLTNASAYGSLSAAYDYDGAGNVQATTYGNGVTNLYQYDNLNRLTNAVWNHGASSLASFYYQLGRTGNRTNLSETVNTVSQIYAWQYDRNYRLTNEMIGSSATGYGLDAVGNRLTRTGADSQSLAYNTNDWLTTDSYDANGNTTGSAGNTYQYDPENHLTNASGVLIVYNGDGLRVAEAVSGVTNYYLLDDRNPTSYPQVVELWTGSTGSAPTWIGAYNYGLSLYSQRVPSLGTKNYYIPDGHGSTRLLVGTTGTVNNAFDYDAYGDLIASNAPAQTPSLYCGYQWDSGSGMYYLNARLFQPNTGRFWTADTYVGNQEDPLSLHKYLYCGSNPVNKTDPSGYDGDVGTELDVVGIQTTIASMQLTAIAVTAGVLVADNLSRNQLFLFHVTDSTIAEIAKKYNGGAFRTPKSSKPMYFATLSTHIASLFLYGALYPIAIKAGLSDKTTTAGIQSFAQDLGIPYSALPSNLQKPSDNPVIILTAKRGSLTGMIWFNGGIYVNGNGYLPLVYSAYTTASGEMVRPNNYKLFYLKF